jgi:hypothetical protein
LDGLTFAIVKDAGFYAVTDQPVAMANILKGFLNGNSLALA